MIRATILIMFLIVAFANAGPTSQTLSASIKDTNVNGIEGLNLKWSAPFKIQNYDVGVKYSLGDFRKVPDSIFAKRSFETGSDGVATVDADYNVADKTLGIAAKWVSDKLGVSFGASGNNKDRVTEVSASSTQNINGNKVTVEGKFHRLENKLDITTRATVDDITAQVDYNSKDRDPILSVAYKLDANNVVTPSVSLKDGDMSYRWNRKISGGSIDTKFHGENVEVEWKDNGSNGVWSTKANIPINNHAGTKISFSREWAY